VSLSNSDAGTVPPSVAATFTAAGALAEEVWGTGSLTVSALQIQRNPSEFSGWSHGAMHYPTVAPHGFAGILWCLPDARSAVVPRLSRKSGFFGDLANRGQVLPARKLL
jgi:hypothetical protein